LKLREAIAEVAAKEHKERREEEIGLFPCVLCDLLRRIRRSAISSRFSFFFLIAVGVLSAMGAQALPPPQMTFLDNGEIRIGMDLALGGAVTFISSKDYPGNIILCSRRCGSKPPRRDCLMCADEAGQSDSSGQAFDAEISCRAGWINVVSPIARMPARSTSSSC
jgi:hypothetical protein